MIRHRWGVRFLAKIQLPSLGLGHPRAGAAQPRSALTLLPMMGGEQDPFDAFDANLFKMIEHAAVPELDEERGLAIAKDINAAGVAPDEEVAGKAWVNRDQLGGPGGEAQAQECPRQKKNSVHVASFISNPSWAALGGGKKLRWQEAAEILPPSEAFTRRISAGICNE